MNGTGEGKPNREQLQLYIEGLDRKIEGAKWKQSTILKYNYMALQSAKQKIEEQSNHYTLKIESLYQRLEIQTRNHEIQSQVNELRSFATKLLQKINDVDQQMKIITMDMALSRAEAQQKRDSFRLLTKYNVELNKLIIEQANKVCSGAQPSKQEPVLNFPPSAIRPMNKSAQQSGERMWKIQGLTSAKSSNIRELYQECVSSMTKSLKSMNASEDVQVGIYLQIMNRKPQKRAPTFSLKSKTCDVLMDRYKDLKAKKSRNDDFCMGLETFMGLNWKQIMGIVLVKDRNASKLKQLLSLEA